MKRRYLLDTGPAFDFLFRRRGVHLRLEALRRSGRKIGIGYPVLAEIAAGLENSASRDESWRIVNHSIGKLIYWPFDEAAALEFGRIQTELRRIGRPMQQIDVMIAAIARSLGSCVLATYDSDLLAVPGLDVENWSLPPSAP